jgi:CCR4-NOT transcription complex subunit 1
LDLLETLAKLAEGGYKANVRSLLEHPLKHCPEVLLASLAASRAEAGQLRKEICTALLPSYVASQPNSAVVLHRVWPLYREAVLAAMADLYSKDPTAMSRILDVCQEMKVLTEVLGVMPFPFALELAALAARREYLNLEKWLQDRLGSFGLPFVLACLEFLDDKTGKEKSGGEGGGAQIQLSVEVLSLFFHFLHANLSGMPVETQEALRKIQASAAVNHPQLAFVGPVDPVGVGDPSDPMPQPASEVFATDVEEEANGYFQRIYTSQITLEDVVGMLKRFKTSSVQREQEIFACMIHNLFDEYRFFPKYPEKELHITAVLFGALVHHQLVSSITLGIALRYVLDALRKPLGSKMHTFGVEALNQFRGSLGQWTQYCQHIMQIPHLVQSQPELATFIEKAMTEATAQGTCHPSY